MTENIGRLNKHNFMGNFQGGNNRGGGFRGGNGGGRPDFQKKSWGGDSRGDRGPVSMHKAICNECNKSCEVPFRPSGDKPVYCSDCFGAKKGNDDRGPRRDFGDRGPKREFNNNRPAPVEVDVKRQLDEIRTKLDRLMSAVEKLTPASAPKVETKKTFTPKVATKKVVSKKAPAKKRK